MSRRPRLVVDDGIYHVMNRGAGRRPVFGNDADRVEFGRLLADVHERFGLVVDAYCLMDNHFHLVVQCPQRRLSAAMQHLSSVYTQHFNERAGIDGPLFRGRFRSLLIDSEEYFVQAVRYVHRNPLDIPGVSAVDGYRWSSHRAYLGLRRAPEFLRTDRVLARFGGDVGSFDRFVRAEPAGERPFTPESVRGVAWLAIGEVGGDGRSGRQLERTLMYLLLDRLPAPERRRLIDELGLTPGSALESARSRARRRHRESEDVRRAFDILLGELGRRLDAA